MYSGHLGQIRTKRREYRITIPTYLLQVDLGTQIIQVQGEKNREKKRKRGVYTREERGLYTYDGNDNNLLRIKKRPDQTRIRPPGRERECELC